MPLTPVALLGLNASETAYTLDSGDTIVVTTTQYTPANDPAWLVLQIDVDLIDPATMATLGSLPSHPVAVQWAGLAGDTTIEAVTAAAHEAAGLRALAWLAAQRALVEIPVNDAPGVPVTRDRSLDVAKVGPVALG